MKLNYDICVISASASKSSQDEVTPVTPQPTLNSSPEFNRKLTNNRTDPNLSPNSIFSSVLTSLMSGCKEVEKQPDDAGSGEACQDGYEFIENGIGRHSTASMNNFKDDNNATTEQNSKLNRSASRTSIPLRDAAARDNVNLTSNVTTAKKVKSNTNSFCQNNKDETISRLDFLKFA